MAKIVIIGGGFGGLTAAQKLGNDGKHHVLLIDRKNHHLFQPLLYQVATAGLSPADIAMPIRSIVSRFPNVRVQMGEVCRIDREQKKLWVVDQPQQGIEYDLLVVAGGANHSYFGHPNWEHLAPGLKTIEQATEIRRRILTSIEFAENAPSVESMRKHLTFVIVGGGPTGVELAGSIAELCRFTLSRDFRQTNPAQARVILIEAGSRVLAGFDPSLSKNAARDLEEMGVQIWLNSRVSKVDQDGICIGEDRVASTNVFWAAGVEPSSLGKMLNTPLDAVGRVKVTDTLQILADPNVFAIGDMAAFTDASGKTLQGLAPVALQQGRHVAKNILAKCTHRNLLPFRYFDKGMMATIGRRRAVLQFSKFKLSGVLAWFAWLFVHIYFLIGFRNRAIVFFQWAWSYLTFKRGARLIVATFLQDKKSP